MIKYQQESFDTVIDDIQGLLELHKNELCMFGEDIELNPNWSKYKELDKIGILNIITMRKNGILIGYYISIIFRHLHYNFTISCNDILYIVKKYRGHAMTFFRFIQKHLEDRGVKVMSFNIKPILDFRNVAEYLGFELLEYTYFKRLS
jgi:hypothetical protein